MFTYKHSMVVFDYTLTHTEERHNRHKKQMRLTNSHAKLNLLVKINFVFYYWQTLAIELIELVQNYLYIHYFVLHVDFNYILHV